MKNLLIKLLVITTLLLASVHFAHANTRIVILGDSLSASLGMKQKEGWVHLLNQQLLEKKSSIELINASISGETTGGGLARIDNILASHKPDTVLIELGGNDGLRGFKIKTIKQNLLQIIEKVKKQDVNVVVMQVRIPPNYGPLYTSKFEDTYKDVAQATDSPLMPFFMDKIAIYPDFMQADGIHPNKEAQQTITDIMEKQILTLNK